MEIRRRLRPGRWSVLENWVSIRQVGRIEWFVSLRRYLTGIDVVGTGRIVEGTVATRRNSRNSVSR